MGRLPRDWEHPEWAVEEKVHNWRNYVSESVQEIWETFTQEQKRALARNFDGAAMSEDWD